MDSDEILDRMNFLATIQEKYANHPQLSRGFGRQLLSLYPESDIKQSNSASRKMCTFCGSLFIAGVNSKVYLRNWRAKKSDDTGEDFEPKRHLYESLELKTKKQKYCKNEMILDCLICATRHHRSAFPKENLKITLTKTEALTSSSSKPKNKKSKSLQGMLKKTQKTDEYSLQEFLKKF